MLLEVACEVQLIIMRVCSYPLLSLPKQCVEWMGIRYRRCRSRRGFSVLRPHTGRSVTPGYTADYATRPCPYADQVRANILKTLPAILLVCCRMGLPG